MLPRNALRSYTEFVQDLPESNTNRRFLKILLISFKDLDRILSKNTDIEQAIDNHVLKKGNPPRRHTFE